MAVAATPLAYRGLVGKWPRIGNGRLAHGDTRAALAGKRGLHVRESIRLEKPLDEVYRFWRQLENLPRIMTHLEQCHRSWRWTIALGRQGAGESAGRMGRPDHQRSRTQGHRLAVAPRCRCRDRGIGQLLERTGGTKHAGVGPPSVCGVGRTSWGVGRSPVRS